jgi:hypothetical protein
VRHALIRSWPLANARVPLPYVFVATGQQRLGASEIVHAAERHLKVSGSSSASGGQLSCRKKLAALPPSRYKAVEIVAERKGR